MRSRFAREAARDPFPEGWFCVADARDVRPEAVVTRRVWGREVVVFRTRSGRVSVVDPVCPHLGAHLGHGGRVERELLLCPFHGLGFDPGGACVATGYPGAPKTGLALRVWPCVERQGFVFAFFSRDARTPDWELPADDPTGFTAPRTRTLRLAGHVADTAENAVDLRHLAVVHGYGGIAAPEQRYEGPHLWSRFRFDRRHPILPFGRVEAVFDTDVWGLGYSRTDLRVEALGIHYRLYLLATPVDERAFDFTIAVCAEHPPPFARGLLARLPWRPFTELVLRASLRAIEHDVRQDAPIWAHKVHLDPPGLLPGDAPIAAFRKWARQFYPV